MAGSDDRARRRDRPVLRQPYRLRPRQGYSGLRRRRVGQDTKDANFIDGGDGTAGGKASSFFKGDAADSDGESVIILTDTGFATGIDAVTAAQNEAMGDLVVCFNTTVNVARLLFVDGLDNAHSIARFANIDSLDDLAAADFTANDFLFV